MKKCLRADELASVIGARLEGDPSKIISGVNDLVHADNTQVSFFANPRYHKEMMESGAGAIIMDPIASRGKSTTYLLHSDPTVAFQKAMHIFLPSDEAFSAFTGIHPTAVVHKTAVIEEGVTLCPYAVIDAGVRIGKNTFIGSHVYIGPRSSIGTSSVIHPHVVVREDSQIGDNVIIQPGAVIGSCGFGYSTDNTGKHTKLEQIGNVVIENDVEIGANTTIDRARFKSTQIGVGTKIDNLVQIAHNVEIGFNSIIISQVGIAGSTKIGNFVVLAGKVAVNGHIEICDKVRVAACSGVSKSIVNPGDYGGLPAQPLAEYNRFAVQLRRLCKKSNGDK
jgi:UDP-3-O-[3-hydroxymyristoyl] glucosamine N-acyltransferase